MSRPVVPPCVCCCSCPGVHPVCLQLRAAERMQQVSGATPRRDGEEREKRKGERLRATVTRLGVLGLTCVVREAARWVCVLVPSCTTAGCAYCALEGASLQGTGACYAAGSSNASACVDPKGTLSLFTGQCAAKSAACSQYWNCNSCGQAASQLNCGWSDDSSSSSTRRGCSCGSPLLLAVSLTAVCGLCTRVWLCCPTNSGARRRARAVPALRLVRTRGSVRRWTGASNHNRAARKPSAMSGTTTAALLACS